MKLITKIAQEMYSADLPIKLQESFTKELWEICYAKLQTLQPQKLGLILFQDKTERSLYDVHSCTWLGKYYTGKEYLYNIAITALISELYAIKKMNNC
jgi:hypothetical protein